MFDFDKETDRRNTGSLKWDVKENELPMWVADMDFETAPAVINAIKARAEHGIFGYSVLPDVYKRQCRQSDRQRDRLCICGCAAYSRGGKYAAC